MTGTRDIEKAARLATPAERPPAGDWRRRIGLKFISLVYKLKRLYRRDFIVVSPKALAKKYTLWKLAKLSGIETVGETDWTPGGREPLAFVRHSDTTWDLDADPAHINGRCVDISKTTVDTVFEEVFGYATRLDPTTFTGRAVVKSEVNFDGKGAFVECPLAPEAVRDKHIYQRLVDNEIEDGIVREYRVGIIGGRIVDVIVADRAVENRLLGRGSGAGRGSRIKDRSTVFPADEIAKIEEFCRRLGLEIGELDVLPDVHENRIYILDANKTSTGLVRASAFRCSRIAHMMRRSRRFRTYLKWRQRNAAGGSLATPGEQRTIWPWPE